MPSTLSEDQRLACFHILEVRDDISYFDTDENGMVQNNYETSGYASMRNALNSKLDQIGRSAKEQVLKTYLDKWISIRFNFGVMQGGNMGDLSGITIDYEALRGQIKREVQDLLPVKKAYETFNKPSTNIARNR